MIDRHDHDPQPEPTPSEWAARLALYAEWNGLFPPDRYPDEPPTLDDSAYFDPTTDFEPSEADIRWWAQQQAEGGGR